MNLHDAAIAYAAKGWPVFPVWHSHLGVCGCPLGEACENVAKHPATRNGLKDATTTMRTIDQWWSRHPYNIGLPTGIGFDVLDLDGPDAVETLQTELAAGTTETSTLGGWILDNDPPISTTGRGWHILYAVTGSGNRARILDHVDWRGSGGYIVAPPSVHATGATYQWGGGSEISPAPTPLAEIVLRTGYWSPPARAERPKMATPDMTLLERLGAATPGKWSAQGLIERVAESVEGERNHVLFWAAATAYEDWVEGECSDDDLQIAIYEIAEAADEAGLGGQEIEQTINSARRTVIK